MPETPQLDAASLAFRLALLDAVPAGRPLAERYAALEAARDSLHHLLERGPAVPDLPVTLRLIQDRAFLATALCKGFEEAWDQLTGRP
ncbi:hypothetical protein SAMN02745194_00948 [Roseomonas rosea]|uniref:Uncharacterized protein n=1 Tax=Muricoccus roseus TaxID=198092 RepID=A0A1M6DHP9_9PROT|nr:hypothetical protein [Roseomonas rosea]SHI72559.1 hypothetical protein SAMN02745194_00948 [Roseomonas rosea]